jgi:hypothetical protein
MMLFSAQKELSRDLELPFLLVDREMLVAI